MSNEALRKHMAMQMANQHNHKHNTASQQDNKNPAALNVIDELFTRLKAITSVGNAFKTESQEAIVKQEWMLAFREEGITKQSMIDDGIDAVRIKARKSRSTTWFPSVGEFIDLCKGNDNKMEFAQRGLDLFNSGQKQIDSVGKMVTGKHGFDLKTMKATETNKRFIELYLMYAENNEIQALESNLLTETVQLSKEQQKDAENRALDAQNQFLSQFSNLIDEKEEVKPVNVESGVKTGSLKVSVKSRREIEDSRQRQLAMIKGKL